ncbi:MAG: hypothetical protein QOJ85_1706 [Solirubrobacteraceae bacterium]|nr:hypothetical protein [Solirubrobacteraceae bacterium]
MKVPGVLTGITVVLGAIVVLLIVTHPFDGDANGPATTSTTAVPNSAATRAPTDRPGSTRATPHRGQTDPPCSDGRDNDSDGKTDFGQDPDCSSPQDWIEKRLACSDRVDNDGDGKTDFGQDPGCASAVDLSE